MKYQDINIELNPIYTAFKEFIAEGDYESAINLLESNSSVLQNRIIISELFNNITDRLVILQQQGLSDPKFKTDKIEVDEQEPQGLEVGKVWFQI